MVEESSKFKGKKLNLKKIKSIFLLISEKTNCNILFEPFCIYIYFKIMLQNIIINHNATFYYKFNSIYMNLFQVNLFFTLLKKKYFFYINYFNICNKFIIFYSSFETLKSITKTIYSYCRQSFTIKYILNTIS